jgi:hypothetical protein
MLQNIARQLRHRCGKPGLVSHAKASEHSEPSRFAARQHNIHWQCDIQPNSVN